MGATAPSEERAAERREALLEAARETFIHYGWRRTSMEAIAREAGLSRTALYHHFSNKEEVFRALCEVLHERVVEAAEAAARGPGSCAERVRGLLDARLGFFFDTLRASRHGFELLDENSRQCGDVSLEAAKRVHRILARVLRQGEQAREIDLAGVGLRPDTAATFLLRCGEGLAGHQRAVPTSAEYRKRLDQLVRIAFEGWGRR
ncbi:MAG: TetR/AcrR family transcriptional regulator [Proteobacteria bacterium]|nr:TetR/AcrR family transcriptional regulator [Pseudomonadota bacterium]